MKFFARLFTVLCLLSSARAAEPADLGSGLAYLRVHSAADSCKAVASAGALVLDLRYTAADETSAAELKTALATRPANAPLFILVSPDTPAVLAPVIHQSPALTLGIVGAKPSPKVVVQAEAAADRAAYAALEAGAAVAALVSGKVEKERYDEATLVAEFNNGNLDAQPPPAPDPTAPAAGKPEEPKAGGDPAKPVVPTDRVLQRAVHLHRALLALRR